MSDEYFEEEEFTTQFNGKTALKKNRALEIAQRRLLRINHLRDKPIILFFTERTIEIITPTVVIPRSAKNDIPVNRISFNHRRNGIVE